MEFPWKKITINKNRIKKVHGIPGGTSCQFHAIFFDPELHKILVGTFYTGSYFTIQKKIFGFEKAS